MSLTYTTNQRHVTYMGQPVSLAQPLLGPMSRPKNGWKAQFTINGSTVPVNGDNPRAVFDEARRVLILNKQEFTDTNLWLNLNIQWLERLPTGKQRLASLESLLAISNGLPSEEIPAGTRRRNYSPEDWGSKGWAMLQQYLAQDVYSFDRFLLLATELGQWVNPSINPSIGCGDCYRHFMPALSELKARPIHSQEGARMWLFNLMNEVNVRKKRQVLSKEQAYKINFWS